MAAGRMGGMRPAYHWQMLQKVKPSGAAPAGGKDISPLYSPAQNIDNDQKENRAATDGTDNTPISDTDNTDNAISGHADIPIRQSGGAEPGIGRDEPALKPPNVSNVANVEEIHPDSGDEGIKETLATLATKATTACKSGGSGEALVGLVDGPAATT